MCQRHLTVRPPLTTPLRSPARPLRNAYQKVGMFGMPAIPTIRANDGGFMGDQVRGFGFLHDGSIDTIERFLSTVFSLLSQQARVIGTPILS
jgi:hypothetical protein